MEEWQKSMWAALAGSNPGEVKIISAGRRVGKSILNEIYGQMSSIGPKSKYVVITHAEVDGRMWYTIRCTKEVADWIRNQPGEGTQWDAFIDANWYIHAHQFDVHEEFYMMLKLRWGI